MLQEQERIYGQGCTFFKMNEIVVCETLRKISNDTGEGDGTKER